jgi:uncharacterized protein (DUF58 family)
MSGRSLWGSLLNQVKSYQQKNAFSLLQSVYETHLTPAGKALFLLMILSISLGMVGTEILIYVLMVSLTALWTVVVFEGFWHRPRAFEIQSVSRAPVISGAEAEIQVWLSYLGKRNLYHLSFELVLRTPQQRLLVLPCLSALDVLEPGQRVLLKFRGELARRGTYLCHQLVVISTFPFDILYWRTPWPLNGQQLVYPEYRILTYLQLDLMRKYQSGGQVLSQQQGEALEFRGIRQYMEGDPPRQIYWPALAKTGKLMVREYQEEYFIRLGVILDTQITEPDSVNPELEAGISLVASISEWIARQEFLIDIFAAGHEIYHFPTGNAHTRLEYLLEILASIQGVQEFQTELLKSAVQPHIFELSAMVVILLRWDEERKALLQMLREQGLVLKVLLIQSPAEADAEPPDLPGVMAFSAEAWRKIVL